MEARDNATDPTVTVLMAVRDGARYLRTAIDSILAQTFGDFELLIVDDASSDESAAIVASYSDPRVRLLRNDAHVGLTRSLNRGIARARGTYLARMDADDLSSPERLERQVAYLAAHPRCGMVATWARVIDDGAEELRVARTPVTGDALRRELLRGNCVTHGTVMMRVDALTSVGPYDESMERAQDYDLWLRMCEAYDVACLPEALYAWREHGQSISGRHRDEQDRFAEGARREALRRRVGRVTEAVARGAVGRRRAAARLADAMREHEERHAPRPSPRFVPDRLWWKLPALQRWGYARRRRPQLDELRAVVDLCASGAVAPTAARDDLVALIESVGSEASP